MNILKIKKQKSGGTHALFEKDSCLSVSQCVCEIVKLSGFERPQKILKSLVEINIHEIHVKI
jgi:hypothetical protein